MSRTTDAATRRLIAAGELLYGARWQSALARAMGCPQGVISMALSGARPPTPRTMRLLATALGRESERLRKSASTLDRLRAEIERDTG